ncbi:unnamed protein product [Rotaria sp. Silwood1]|nr:unnamed protein product [Rotaria sp. Silwood1]
MEHWNIFNNENINEEQKMIDRTSIICSSNKIIIELVGYEHHLMDKTVLEFATSTQQLQSQTRVYVVFRALISAHYSTKVNEWAIL